MALGGIHSAADASVPCLIRALADEARTLIFYESPRRLTAFLSEIRQVMGDRYGVLSREMTKRYEEFIRGPISQIQDELEARPQVKGECTLLIAGAPEKEAPAPGELPPAVTEEIKLELAAGTRLADLSKRISRTSGISRRQIYEAALKIKEKHK